MRAFDYDRQARRLRILGQRIHHGSVGVTLATLGVVLALHDRHDWRHWFRIGDTQSALENSDNQAE